MAGELPPRSGWTLTFCAAWQVDSKLRVVGIVPDASALSAFLPWQPDDVQGLAWRDEASWLWATSDSWGCCPCSDAPSFQTWYPG